MKQPNHPNCPYCSTNIAKRYELNVNYYLDHINVVKLYRLYTRISNDNKRKFVAIGWYCRNCGFSITEQLLRNLRRNSNVDVQLIQIKRLKRELKEKGI